VCVTTNKKKKHGSNNKNIGLAALQEEERHPDARFHARYPFSSNWPLIPDLTPPISHVFSAAASYPLIFLAQISTYAWALEKMGKTQSDPVFCSSGALSQGVVSALVASISKDDDELVANAVLFTRYMFWHGLRCQTNDLKVAPGSLVASIGPMLAIQGLSPQVLAKVIEKTNAELRSKSAATAKAGPALVAAQAELESTSKLAALHLSLINGPKQCVVSGRPVALQALKAVVDKMGAQGVSQSRVPFSKRKPEISTSFLTTASPFHCELNRAAYEQILLDLERLQMHRIDLTLRFPVLSTHTGAAVSGDNILHQIVLMQTCLLADFTRIDVPPQVTHVLEFGPGGNDGIGGAAKYMVSFLFRSLLFRLLL